MAVYYLGIDETGDFHIETPARDETSNRLSFVCGVLIPESKSDSVLRLYQDAYTKLFPENTAPNEPGELAKKFHYTDLWQKPRGKDVLSEMRKFLKSKKIFRSTGRPLLWANGPNYRLTSIAAVISGLFKKNKFQAGDVINIEIEHVKDDYFGLTPGDPLNKETLDEKDDDYKSKQLSFFNSYHDLIKRQLQNIVEQYEVNNGIKVKIKFISKSLYANLADIAAGSIRHIESKTIDIAPDERLEPSDCPCEEVMMNPSSDPASLIGGNPVGALNIILANTLSGKSSENCDELIPKAFENAVSNESGYAQLWDIFNNFLQFGMKTGGANGNFIMNASDIVTIFLSEFKKNSDKLPTNKQLEYANSFMKYYSHAGDTQRPIGMNRYADILNRIGGTADEGRIVRKWAGYVSYSIRAEQFNFNKYDFSDKSIGQWRKFLEKQKKIIEIIGEDSPFETEKDEHTAAILGTLGQCCAFRAEAGDIEGSKGFIKDARICFNDSLKYASKDDSKNQTYSYLQMLAFMEKDIGGMREYLKKQTGGASCESEDFVKLAGKNAYAHLSYARLRALELYKNSKTLLREIDIPVQNRGGKYPWPLVLKWIAVAKLLKNTAEDSEAAKPYLTAAIKNLIDDKNGFTIKTLALPVIQLLALAAPDHRHVNEYQDHLSVLMKEEGFAEYVETRAPLLKDVRPASAKDRKVEVWKRATSLPFYYS